MLSKPLNQSVAPFTRKRGLHVPCKDHNFVCFRINSEVAAAKAIFPAVEVNPVQSYILVMQLIDGVVRSL
jgi:hypothetical protein